MVVFILISFIMVLLMIFGIMTTSDCESQCENKKLVPDDTNDFVDLQPYADKIRKLEKKKERLIKELAKQEALEREYESMKSEYEDLMRRIEVMERIIEKDEGKSHASGSDTLKDISLN